jgi:hypothetical protein
MDHGVSPICGVERARCLEVKGERDALKQTGDAFSCVPD